MDREVLLDAHQDHFTLIRQPKLILRCLLSGAQAYKDLLELYEQPLGLNARIRNVVSPYIDGTPNFLAIGSAVDHSATISAGHGLDLDVLALPAQRP
jgi:hypothetical protein